MSGKPSSARARQIDDARDTSTISDRNTRTAHLYPPGPDEPYSPAQDLLSWMNNHFKQYGDIYKASVYGSSIYVISAPEYAEHVLRKNWQNYRKGLAIKRVAWLLGNGRAKRTKSSTLRQYTSCQHGIFLTRWLRNIKGYVP